MKIHQTVIRLTDIVLDEVNYFINLRNEKRIVPKTFKLTDAMHEAALLWIAAEKEKAAKGKKKEAGI